jgi:hypothetical protein
VANGGALTGNTRYLQYQAVLSTTDVKSTPVLKDISFTCSSTATANRMSGSTILDQPMLINGLKAGSGFSLGQNYPNPFNGHTVITYEVPAQTMVRISIFDVYGRLIRVAQEGMTMPGRHMIQADLSRLAKGIYYYRMEADGFKQTRKMVIQ